MDISDLRRLALETASADQLATAASSQSISVHEYVQRMRGDDYGDNDGRSSTDTESSTYSSGGSVGPVAREERREAEDDRYAESCGSIAATRDTESDWIAADTIEAAATANGLSMPDPAIRLAQANKMDPLVCHPDGSYAFRGGNAVVGAPLQCKSCKQWYGLASLTIWVDACNHIIEWEDTIKDLAMDYIRKKVLRLQGCPQNVCQHRASDLPGTSGRAHVLSVCGYQRGRTRKRDAEARYRTFHLRLVPYEDEAKKTMYHPGRQKDPESLPGRP